MASLLALLALVTLALKTLVEWRHAKELQDAAALPEPAPLAAPPAERTAP